MHLYEKQPKYIFTYLLLVDKTVNIIFNPTLIAFSCSQAPKHHKETAFTNKMHAFSKFIKIT